MTLFYNRREAGRKLAEKLQDYKNRPDVAVIGLPRGGVVVAAEVAHSLNLPLEVWIVRKLGVPWQPELAMGAMAEGDILFRNKKVAEMARVGPDEIDKVIEAESRELRRRQKVYRGHQAPPKVEGKEVILVDDGLATGSTIHAAILALKKGKAEKIIVAVPVGAEETCEEIRREVDGLICLYTPFPFDSIGQWYESFEQTTDEEVIALLERYQKSTA